METGITRKDIQPLKLGPGYFTSIRAALAVLFTMHARELNLLYNIGSADDTAYSKLAASVGFEPTARRLTVVCSTTELRGNETLYSI